jgi:hypothetical protein
MVVFRLMSNKPAMISNEYDDWISPYVSNSLFASLMKKSDKYSKS